MKLSVLKKAVLQEREKVTELEKNLQTKDKRIQDLEDLVNEKVKLLSIYNPNLNIVLSTYLQENEVINISNEKYNLQAKLDIERAKLEKNNEESNGGTFSSFIKRTSLTGSSTTLPIKSEPEFIQISDDNVKLTLEKETLKRNLDERKEDFDKCKDQYQVIILKQTEQIKKGEKDLVEKKVTIEEMNMRLQQAYEKFKKYDIEKMKLENKISEMGKENKLLQENIKKLEEFSTDKLKLIESYQDNLIRHEKESAHLALKLAELKNVVIESLIL